MSALIISGPPASGKNTVAEPIAQSHKRASVIDTDVLRNTVVEPYRDPWDGEEGRGQQLLAARNACAMARNFETENYSTIILDVIDNELAASYRQFLDGIDVTIILLLPTKDEIDRRLLTRTDYLTRGDTHLLYEQQTTFTAYDHKLDNTALAASDAANWILERWNT